MLTELYHPAGCGFASDPTPCEIRICPDLNVQWFLLVIEEEGVRLIGMLLKKDNYYANTTK